MSERTPQQVVADAHLREAIEECVLAYGMAHEQALITGFVVLGKYVRADRADVTGYFKLLPENEYPDYDSLIGILRYNLLLVERDALTEDGPDE